MAVWVLLQDPLFHFHLLPRYGAPVEFAGRQWHDSGWPGPPTLGDDQAGDDRVLRELQRAYADDGRFT
jgi:hypothetical protein